MKSDVELESHLNQFVQTIKAQAPGQMEDDAMQNRLLASIDAYEPQAEKSPVRSLNLLTYFWQQKVRTALQMPNWRWAGSAALACAVVISLFIVSGVPKPAFAAVVKQLNNISSMHYQGEMTSRGKPMMKLAVYYRAPDQIRIENTPLVKNGHNATMINVMNVSQGKGLILMPAPKMAMPFEFTPNANPSSEQDDPLYWFEAIKNYRGDVENLAEQTINGIQAVGYRLHVNNIHITLWADRQTELPVKIWVTTDKVAGQSPFTLEADLVFNQPLDDELFSLTPDDSYALSQDTE